MFYKFFFKQKIKKQRQKIKKLYGKSKNIYSKSHSYQSIIKYYDSCFFLTLPKKQQFFSIFYLKTCKFYSYSLGQILGKFSIKAKYFKKSYKNIASLMIYLKRYYFKILKKIYLFNIKNYNFRQYLFLFKMLKLIKPKIYYLVHRQSYIPRFLPKRRIKRSVLRIINRT